MTNSDKYWTSSYLVSNKARTFLIALLSMLLSCYDEGERGCLHKGSPFRGACCLGSMRPPLPSLGAGCSTWVVVSWRAAQCPTMLQFKRTDQRPSMFLKGISDLQKCKWHYEAESHHDF